MWGLNRKVTTMKSQRDSCEFATFTSQTTEFDRAIDERMRNMILIAFVVVAVVLVLVIEGKRRA